MSFALSTLRDRVLSSIGLGTGFADTIKQFRLNINSVNKKESIMPVRTSSPSQRLNPADTLPAPKIVAIPGAANAYTTESFLQRLGGGVKRLFSRRLDKPEDVKPEPAGLATTEWYATCPNCEHEFRLSPDSSFDSQSTVSCPSCKKWFELTDKNTKTVKPSTEPVQPEPEPAPASAVAPALKYEDMTPYQKMCVDMENVKQRSIAAVKELSLASTTIHSDGDLASAGAVYAQAVAAASAAPVAAVAPASRRNIVSLRQPILVAADPTAVAPLQPPLPKRFEAKIDYQMRVWAYEETLKKSPQLASAPAMVDLSTCIDSGERWQKALGTYVAPRSAFAELCDATIKAQMAARPKNVTVYCDISGPDGILAKRREAASKASPRALHAAALANAAV